MRRKKKLSDEATSPSFPPRLQDDVMKYREEVDGKIQLRRSWAHMGKCISGRELVFFLGSCDFLFLFSSISFGF